jgi:hypothetical protein
MLYAPSGGPWRHKTWEDVSEGKTTTGEEVHQVFEAMLPQGEIDHHEVFGQTDFLYQRDCGLRSTFCRWFDEPFDRFM